MKNFSSDLRNCKHSVVPKTQLSQFIHLLYLMISAHGQCRLSNGHDGLWWMTMTMLTMIGNNKAFRERRHPSAPRSVNEQPIHWPTGWKLIYLPCTVAHKEAHCASNIVSNSHLFHSKPIKIPIPKIWLLKIWPWKYKVKVRGEVKVLSHNLGLTSYQIVLEIPTGAPVWGRQLWRRTAKFLLIFLKFNVYDLRFKPWGPTTFWLSFQHCIRWIHILVCQFTLLFLW